MQQVVVKQFGDVEALELIEQPTPSPESDQILIQLTSIGMNHAELMQRAGYYKATSGDPPFTPGLEAGGIIQSVGRNVNTRHTGQRVILTLDATRNENLGRGTYTSHYLTTPNYTLPAPDGIPDTHLGILWLPYLTAWGALIHRAQIKPTDFIMIPAASSSVAIAAAQIAKQIGAKILGTTTSPEKIELLNAMPEAPYDIILDTNNEDWYKQAKAFTEGKGFNLIFDPVAAGEFLNAEIKLLAKNATLIIYGLLGKPDVVNITPLILKSARIQGFVIDELLHEPEDVIQTGYEYVLKHVATKQFNIPIAGKFKLAEVQKAHTTMHSGSHIGKFILTP